MRRRESPRIFVSPRTHSVQGDRNLCVFMIRAVIAILLERDTRGVECVDDD